MLASHTLVWLGVPLSRVMRRVAQVREEHYQLLQGLFRGEGDSLASESPPARLHTVTLDAQAHAVGRELSQLRLDGVQVRAVRRSSVRQNLSAADAGALQAGDVVVLLGLPDELAAAEDRLLRG
jgi:CPA2 family monovalent cation:H+ antiporter-2